MTRQQLTAMIRSTGTYLCVGLDTDPTKIPAHLQSHADPVFEFNRAPPGAIKVSLRGQPIGAEHYAWDGRVLWLDATIESPTLLVVRFEH